MKKFPDLPPIWALAMAMLSWLLAGIFPVLLLPPLPLAATLVGAGGLTLILWSAFWFRRKQTSIEPHHTPTALIVEGPYRLSRNPIYLGMALILAGLALWFGAVSSWLPVLAFPVIITRRFIDREEAALRAAFGSEAEDYLTRTGRWLRF